MPQRLGQVKSLNKTLVPAAGHGAVLLSQPPPRDGCSVRFQALWSISHLALVAPHHLVGYLNPSVQAFSHCLFAALFRARPAAPAYLKGPPSSVLWFVHRTLPYCCRKINILSWLKNVTITAVKPVKYSTIFRIRKHQLKDRAQFWASFKKTRTNWKQAAGEL